MRVQIPDKNTYIDFPDGTPPDEIKSVIETNWDNLDNKSWGVEDTARSVAATAGSFAALPVAGIAGLSRLITTGSLDEANKTIEGISAVPQKLLQTDRQKEVTQNVGNILSYPFRKAGEGWAGLTELVSTGDLQKATDVIEGTSGGSNIFVPTAKVLGEASAMAAVPGVKGEALKFVDMIKKIKDPLQRKEFVADVTKEANETGKTPDEIITEKLPREEIKPVEQPVESPEMPPVETKVIEGVKQPWEMTKEEYDATINQMPPKEGPGKPTETVPAVKPEGGNSKENFIADYEHPLEGLSIKPKDIKIKRPGKLSDVERESFQDLYYRQGQLTLEEEKLYKNLENRDRERIPINEIINSPLLFEKYPFLKNKYISFSNNIEGMRSHEMGITIGKNSQFDKELFLHELTHVIRSNQGNTSLSVGRVDKFVKDIFDYSSEELSQYLNTPSELEARASKYILNGTYDKNKLASSIYEEIKKRESLPNPSRSPGVGEHRNIVSQALAEGKSVPPEVLKDYPELAKVTGEGTLAKEPSTVTPPESTKVAVEGTESKLAIRTETVAIEKGLTQEPFGELAGYEKIPGFMKDQAERAVAIMDSDYQSAVKMALGEIKPPDGTLPATMYKAVEKRAIEQGDFDTLYKLGTESTIPQRQSLLGREIKAADVKMSDSPLDAMQEVRDARTTTNIRLTGKKPPQPSELATLKQAVDSTKMALDEHYSKAGIDELIKSDIAQPKIKYGSRNKIVTTAEYEKTKIELSKQLASQLSSGLDPTIAYKMGKIGTYHLEAGVRSFEAWSRAVIKDVGEWVKPYLPDLWKSTKDSVHKFTIEQFAKKISKAVESGADLPDIGIHAQALAKQFIAEGIKDRDSVVMAVHDVLKDIIPEITPRETADAISGYGKYKLLSKDEISVQLRDIKGQLQQISKLEDLQNRQPPLKTGVERRTPSDIERRLIAEVNAAKVKYGIKTLDPETQLKSALDAVKTRLKNDTQKLIYKLNNLDLAKSEKRHITLDAEASKLKAAHEIAKKNYKAAQEAAVTVTKEEATRIVELSKATTDLKQNFNETTQKWTSPQDKADYGAAKVAYLKYVESLKNPHLSIPQMIINKVREAKVTFRDNKVKAGIDLTKDTINSISDASIAFVASVDNSFLGRQGMNTLLTHPTIWGKAATKSFSDIYKSLVRKHGHEMANDALMADVYSRPNYMNGNYDIAKLIPKTEEQFPTSIPERIPVIGRAFTASESAFANSAIRMRINTFDLLQEIAKRNGVDITDKVQIQNMGKLINSITARGDLGRFGDGGVIRLVMWAPKMLKGNWDVLTAHTGGAGLETSFARQQARINLLKIVSSTATVVAVANALSPGSVETDPRSSDFLKIRVGNTRYDISGGKASIITLLARAITFKTKSSVTKKITPLNSGKYGTKTVFDVGIDFLANKTTPMARMIIDITRGRNFQGQKASLGSAVYGLTTPIAIQNFVQNFYGPDADGSVAAVVGSIVDLVGINANTYKQNRKVTPLK